MTEDLGEIKKVLRSVWWTQKRLDADLERLAWLRAKAEGVRGLEYDRQTVHGGYGPRRLISAVDRRHGVKPRKKVSAIGLTQRGPF